MDVRSRSYLNRVAMKKRRNFRSKTILCLSCDGRGWMYTRVYTPCPECQGRGFQEQQIHNNISA